MIFFCLFASQLICDGSTPRSHLWPLFWGRKRCRRRWKALCKRAILCCFVFHGQSLSFWLPARRMCCGAPTAFSRTVTHAWTTLWIGFASTNCRRLVCCGMLTLRNCFRCAGWLTNWLPPRLHRILCPQWPLLQAPELHFKDAISHGDFVVVGWPHVKVDEPSWHCVRELVATDCAAESKMRLFLKELADEPDPNSMLEKVGQLLGVRCVLSLVCCSLLTLSSLRVLCCWVAMWALLWLSLRRPCLGAARCAHTPAPLQQLSGLL